MKKRIVLYIASILSLYITLPVYLAGKQTNHPLKSLFLFYLSNILVLAFLFKKHSTLEYRFDYQIQGLEEKTNIVTDENLKERKNSSALQEKINRYNDLKEIIEKINEDLELEFVADTFTQIAFSTISNKKGVCALYLVDNQTQKLQLFKTKKEDKNLIIRAKEGDIFDLWVSRHASALLIEDMKKDFRFDQDKLQGEEGMRVVSLISSPLISEEKFIGILRLDSNQPHFYTQDDLRFLVTLCDLGAVALENSQLFKYTQELAIHDGLTCLYTKGYFLERLKDECKRGVRKSSIFSLLLLDIDFFKNYNDKFGHTAGDIVLKKLSQAIVDYLCEFSPVVSRFGGEEFCIILLGVDKNKAINIADGLREKIAKERIVLRRQETNITVSIGVAAFPAAASSEDDLLQKADKAMYEAKKKGRNRVCSI